MKKGWEVKKLGNVSKVQRGLTYSRKDTVDISENIVLRATNISLENQKLDFSELKYLNNNFKIDDKYKLKKDSILICFSSGSKSHLGKVALVDSDYNFSFGGFIGQINPSNEIDSQYLFYNLISDNYRSYILGLTNGVNINNLKSNDLKNFQIPIPPLPEQKQIVAILDKAFAAIDQAQANIEKNIENAKELFQSKLNDIFSQKGEDWEEKSLGELSLIKSGGTPSRSKKEYWEGGTIPWYSSGELNKTFTKNPERHITKSGLENSNARVFPKGSLLVGMYDTAALKMSIIDRDATFNQAIVGIEPSDNINLIFIMHSINSQKTDILSLRRGVRQKNLNQSKIKAITIWLPGKSIQNKIVSDLELIQNKQILIESHYHQKLAHLEDLKKSILQKAFSGELTADMADVASEESVTA